MSHMMIAHGCCFNKLVNNVCAECIRIVIHIPRDNLAGAISQWWPCFLGDILSALFLLLLLAKK